MTPITVPLAPLQIARLENISHHLNVLTAQRDDLVRFLVAGHVDPVTVNMTLEGSSVICTPLAPALVADTPAAPAEASG